MNSVKQIIVKQQPYCFNENKEDSGGLEMSRGNQLTECHAVRGNQLTEFHAVRGNQLTECHAVRIRMKTKQMQTKTMMDRLYK